MRFLAKKVRAAQRREKFFRPVVGGSGGMLPQKILKIMFSKLAEIDFPGIKFTKRSKVRNWSDDLAKSHEISSHARETTQNSVSLTANIRDLETMTMYWYIKYWFVKHITESFTSFVLFSSTF